MVAIGECGLDYKEVPESSHLISSEEKERQKKLFIRHLELAQEVDKPLMIHCNQAHEDLFEILKNNTSRLRSTPGAMHFFGGEGAWEKKYKYLAMGFLLSGVITFPKYGHAEEIKSIPLEKILTETDAPYVAPVPHRGKRNEPSYVVEVAKKIAELRGETLEKIAEATTQNAKKLFGIN